MRLALLLGVATACVTIEQSVPNDSPLALILPTGYDDSDTLSVSVMINWNNAQTLHMQPDYGFGDDVAVSVWVRPSQSSLSPEATCWDTGEQFSLNLTDACTGVPVNQDADWRNFSFFVAVNVCYYNDACDDAAAAAYLNGAIHYGNAKSTDFGQCRRYWAHQSILADIGEPEYIIYNIVSVTPLFNVSLEIRAPDAQVETTLTMALPTSILSDPAAVVAAAAAIVESVTAETTPDVVVVVVVEAKVEGRVDVPPDITPVEQAVLLTAIEGQACAGAPGDCEVVWNTARRRRLETGFTGEYTVIIALANDAPTLPPIIIEPAVLTTALAVIGSVVEIEDVTVAIAQAVVSVEVVMVQATAVVLSPAVAVALVEAVVVAVQEVAPNLVLDALVPPTIVSVVVAAEQAAMGPSTDPRPAVAGIVSLFILMAIWAAFSSDLDYK